MPVPARPQPFASVRSHPVWTNSDNATSAIPAGGRMRIGISRKPNRRFVADAFWSVVSRGTEPGQAGGLLRAWAGWERLAQRLWPACPVDGAPTRLLKLRLRQYQGGSVALADGLTIHNGDQIVELHCNNPVILDMSMHGINVWRVCRDELGLIADWLCKPQGEAVKALFGITILSGAAARMGFTIRPRNDGYWSWAEKVYMTGLLILYSPKGLARLEEGRIVSRQPCEVWMPRQTVVRLYCPVARTDGVHPRRSNTGSMGSRVGAAARTEVMFEQD